MAVNKSDAELGAVTLSTSEFPAAAVMTTYGGSRDMLEPLMLELSSFLESVSSGKPPRVGGNAAANALELALRITDQIRAGN